MKKIVIILMVIAIACLYSCRKTCNCETQYVSVTQITDSITGASTYQSSMSSLLIEEYTGKNKKCSDLDYRKVDSLGGGSYEYEDRACVEN